MKKLILLLFILLPFTGLANEDEEPDTLKKKITRNNVAFNTLGIFAGNLSLSYERFSPKGYFSIAVPLIIHIIPPEYLFVEGFYNSGIASGAEFNFYPKGKARGYLVGASFLMGEFNGNKFYLPMLNNGILFQHSERINASAILGLGLISVMNEGYQKKSSDPFFVRFACNVGYKF